MELSSQIWNYRPQVSGVLITPLLSCAQYHPEQNFTGL